ncbi:hypothetical protein TAC_0173 [Acinetobacter phage TAC1]|nr:hypothetical protein TAC_0173 [Acinetobacter phage TAC1]
MDKSELINLAASVALSFLGNNAEAPQGDGFVKVYNDANESMFVLKTRESLVGGAWMKTATVKSVFKQYPNIGTKVEGSYLVNCENRRYTIDSVMKVNSSGKVLDVQHATFRTWYKADDQALENMIDFVCEG